MHLHLDCFSGIAGDMTLGALLDLGASEEVLIQELGKLKLEDWRLETERRQVGSGLTGLGVIISSAAAPASHPGRRHAEIAELIGQSELEPRVKKRSLGIFAHIAQAEADVHNVPVEDVRFHEVGALDSIIDIVGVCIALELLEVETVSSTPLPLSRGFTGAAHGDLPLPAPATVGCLVDVPCYSSGLDVELVTPTGAAIVGNLASVFTDFPKMTISKVGYGAGSRRLTDRPNALRAILGRLDASEHQSHSSVWELEANIDDQTAEELAHAANAVRDSGAIDVWLTPILMKKGRLGHCLGALAPNENRQEVAEAILRHTTSLGVRMVPKERVVLARGIVYVETPLGSVGVKVGKGPDGAIWNLAPEQAHCESIANKHQIPVKQVRQMAMAAALEQLGWGITPP